MLRWDRQLENWVVDHRVHGLNPVARALSTIGTNGAVWLLIAAVVAIGTRKWSVFLWVAAADALAQGATILVKAAVPRARPNVEALVPKPSSHSFPSGHAASSFACALVLTAYVPRLAFPLFVLAALIAISRVYVGVHFPLDVIAGAGLGLLIGAVLLALRHAATERSRSFAGSRGTPLARPRR